MILVYVIAATIVLLALVAWAFLVSQEIITLPGTGV